MEIEAIRKILAAQPRPAGLAERRKRLDALGAQYRLPADVRVTPVDANGVRAEWTETPVADASRAILFLHGGGYISGSLDSHRHMIAEAGRQAGARRSRSIIASRPSIHFRQRSRTRFADMPSCSRKASSRDALRSPAKAPAAASPSRRSSRCETPVTPCRLAPGSALPGSISSSPAPA